MTVTIQYQCTNCNRYSAPAPLDHDEPLAMVDDRVEGCWLSTGGGLLCPDCSTHQPDAEHEIA